MTRFILAATLAVGGTLGLAGTSDAQVVYGYSTFTPGGALVTNRQVYTPFAAQSATSVFNPWTGYSAQRFGYNDVFGTQVGRSVGVNPLLGTGYNLGYTWVNPVNPFMPAYGTGFGMPGYGFRRW